MANNYLVLIIDDDQEVLRRLDGRIQRISEIFEGKTYSIDFKHVHVEVEKINNHYQISKETIERLADICSHQSPHLILADYGFAQKDVVKSFRGISNQGKEITEDDLKGKVLTTVDLADAVKKYIDDKNTDPIKRQSLKSNLLNQCIKLYLYSYTSKEFYKALGPMEERVKRTNNAFGKFKVIPIDTKYEFYNKEEFDSPPNTKHESKFYAHLISGLLNNIIQLEFTKYILNDTKRLKYVRVKRGVLSVGAIVAIGSAIGASSEWLGSRILNLFSSGFHSQAYILITLTIVAILVMGVLVPIGFERVITGLLKKKTLDEDTED
jgi:hypothetical protein